MTSTVAPHITNPELICHNIDGIQCPPCINIVCGLTPATFCDHIWKDVRAPAVPLYSVFCIN